MGLLDRITGRGAAREAQQQVARVVEVAYQQAQTIELLEEASAATELSFSAEDAGWERVTGASARQVARQTLQGFIERARLAYVLNPLIQNAARIQVGYVFGQGVGVKVQADAINEVVQRWWDEPGNRKVLTRMSAMWRREVSLQNTGNLFFALFTEPATGRVKVRIIDVDEMQEVISDPDDRESVWFYRRRWQEQRFSTYSGRTENTQRERLYPSLEYALNLKPVARPQSVGGVEVAWDSPVYHVKAGEIDDMQFGLPEMFSALDWAKAVKQDMEDHATVKRAHARFAYSLIVKGGASGVSAAKTRLGSTLGDIALGQAPETNPPPVVGSTFIASDGAANLQLMRTAGAAASPDESRALRLMVAAGTGTPETMLTGDSDVGNYATAKTLDRPTELRMRMRQELWREVFTDIVEYVIRMAVMAPSGALRRLGAVGVDGYIKWQVDPESERGEPYDATVVVAWPDLLERDPKTRVDAVISAATLNGEQRAGTMDDDLLQRELLDAIGVHDPGAEIERMRRDAAADEVVDVQPTEFAAALREVREAVRVITG